MVHRCDVCELAEGKVFCMADQAVMCEQCDIRVHTANKLARKHERVPLTVQKSQDKCDICQEDVAVIFCSEDRALMCRRCDLMVHKANALTGKHHRHLMSGLVPAIDALPEFPESDCCSSDSPLSSPGLPTMPLGQPSGSSGFTLAAELLDMPMLPETYTAKDIDAAWFLDGASSLSDDFNSLFQVPDLDDFGPNAMVPSLGKDKAVWGQDARPSSPSDGVVPSLDVRPQKRQRS